jgi:hypothetical protein
VCRTTAAQCAQENIRERREGSGGERKLRNEELHNFYCHTKEGDQIKEDEVAYI